MKNTAGDLAPPCFRVTPWKKATCINSKSILLPGKKVKSHFTINKGYCRRSYTSFIFKPICRVTLHAGLRHAPSLQYAFSPHWLHQRNHQSSTGGSTGAGSLGPTGGTTGSTGFTGAGSLGPAGGSTGGFTGAGSLGPAGGSTGAGSLWPAGGSPQEVQLWLWTLHLLVVLEALEASTPSQHLSTMVH